MKIFGTPLSPYVRKVLMVVHLKGISVDFQMVTPHADNSDFKEASPFGLVPAMDDDGFLLSDSSAIVLYMERRTPTPPLLPGDPKDYGRALWLEEFGDSILGKACGGYALHVAYGPRLFNQPADEGQIRKYAEEEIPAVLTYLETVTPGSGFLTGAEFGIADASVVAALMTLPIFSYSIDEKRWPKVAAYMERALAHPVVAGQYEHTVQTGRIIGLL